MTDGWPDSQDFWHNKRVLVTGGNGFLGKYVVRKLQERGANVFVADKDRYDLRHLEDIRRALSDSKPQVVIHPSTPLRACLRRLEDIRRALSDAKPQVVIHLAARVGGIGANSERLTEFF